MKLLFDENVSPRLAQVLANEYPGSVHVRTAGLLGTDDHRVWDYGRSGGFAIVSKDTDFRERSFVEGFAPKVIWLDVGNAGTSSVAELLRRERHRLECSQLIVALRGGGRQQARTSLRSPLACHSPRVSYGLASR